MATNLRSHMSPKVDATTIANDPTIFDKSLELRPNPTPNGRVDMILNA